MPYNPKRRRQQDRQPSAMFRLAPIETQPVVPTPWKIRSVLVDAVDNAFVWVFTDSNYALSFLLSTFNAMTIGAETVLSAARADPAIFKVEFTGPIASGMPWSMPANPSHSDANGAQQAACEGLVTVYVAST